jgi:excisionase family DNA binding protein
VPDAGGTSSVRALLSVEEAAEALAISRTLMYAHLKAGLVESVKVGRRRFVPAQAIASYVEELVGRSAPPSNSAEGV